MIVCRRPLILVIDLVGVALSATLAATVVFLVVLPHCRDQWRLPALQKRITAMHRHKSELEARNTASLTAVRELERRLHESSDSALTDVGGFLEDMSRECRRSNITLEQFQPMLPVTTHHSPLTTQDYASWDVRVAARGRFPDFQKLLSWIEARSRFTYVREIDVIGSPSPTSSDCRLSWTVRINYLPDRSTTVAAGASPAEETAP
jgi:hypothetical protein